MNSKIAFIIGTVVGAGIGVAGTYSYFKDKYEKLAEEDFNSRRAFDQDKKDESEEPVTEKTADSRTVYNPSIAECAAILQKEGYVNYSDMSKKEQKQKVVVDRPYVIQPSEFGEYDDYEKISLTYTADGVLLDDMNEIDDDDFNLKDLEDMYYDINSYADNLFIDMDFLFLDLIYNNHKMGSTLIEDKLGINLDYYFEILPLDIQKQYKTKHITLSGELSSLLDYIENRIHNGNLNQLFWVDNRPVNEERIHLILENIMDAYFHNKDIEITREALVGNGKVDFSLLKNDNEKEKILIEVKRANSSYLKKGYENQLTKYMYASNCKNAFYLIACFTDSEYNTAYKFIRENVYTDEIQMYINIAVLDLRKRKVPSKF